MTIARQRQEIRAMPDLIASYSNQTLSNQTLASGTRSNGYSVTGTLNGRSVHTAPPPPSEVRKNSPSGYYSRRPNNKLARRNAIKTAMKAERRDAVTSRRAYLEPFKYLDGLLDPVFNRIHETAVDLGIIPPAEIPPIAPRRHITR
jgi:hypothetical protein